MPLAWVDEIAGLEPAINFVQGNGYTSQLWPQQGVEKQFLAYLPLQGWLHIICQYILGFSIYMVRLPYALYLLIGAVFLFLALRKYQFSLLFACIITLLFLNEKSLFETTRGIRVEPIAFLLLSISAYGLSSKKYVLLTIASSLMIFLHPYLWPAAIVFLLTVFYYNNEYVQNPIFRFVKPNIFWLIPIGVLCFFLFFIHFDFALFHSQFVDQASRHSTFGGIGTLLYNHFVRRFWPYYITQPYVPLMVYGALGYALYSVSQKKYTPAIVALLLTHVVWLFFLGPMHRYDIVLVFLSLFAILPLLTSRALVFSTKWSLVAIVVVLSISSVDVVSRHLLTTVQRTERDPELFLSWINERVDTEPSLISGHEIAYYASVPSSTLDFFLFNTTPYRFDFDTYENLYLISDRKWPNHKVVDRYIVSDTLDWDWLQSTGSLTYNGLYLLKANTSKDYKSVLEKMKATNTKNRSKLKYK